MVRTSLFFMVVAWLCVRPDPAAAQGQWDVAGTVGVYAGRTPRDEDYRYLDDRFHVVQGGLTVGRHLSRNLKVEFEGSVTGRGRQYVERLVTIPGYPYPYSVGAEAETSVRSIGAAVTWQFGDNQWVHPFVRAGLSADFDRRLVRIWDQFTYQTESRGSGAPIRAASPRVEGPTTTATARALLGVGTKLYVSPRAFVRAETMAALDRSRQNVMLRVGLGLDF